MFVAVLIITFTSLQRSDTDSTPTGRNRNYTSFYKHLAPSGAETFNPPTASSVSNKAPSLQVGFLPV